MTGLPGDGANLNHAIGDFRNFHFKQTTHEVGMSPCQYDANSRPGFAHIQHVGPDPITHAIGFFLNLLASRQDRLDFPKIHNHRTPVNSRYRTGNNLALQVCVLVEVSVPFGFANLLNHHLLRRLCRNSAQQIPQQVSFQQRAVASERWLTVCPVNPHFKLLFLRKVLACC